MNVKWQRLKISDLPLKGLSISEKKGLELEFTKEEVLEALNSYDGNKAQGPEGMNLSFIQANREMIEEDFMKFIVWEDGFMSDYRPISLVGSMYKVLAKVLANRMKRVMASIIAEYQMAFVKERQILGSFIVTEEIIQEWKKKKEGGLLVKLDFEKAYDIIDNVFLDFMLERIGFGERWRMWMRDCITSPTLSVLVNGSPTSHFNIERGLRQGDPLSPLLFNVVVEGLSSLLRKAHDLDMIRGISFGNSEVDISHLQFADDTMLFLKPKYGLSLEGKKNFAVFRVGFGAVHSLLDSDSKSVEVLKEGILMTVGNDGRIRFWSELKWDSFPLKLAFPRIYAFAQNKEGRVKDFGSWVDNTWKWKVELRRPLFDWEVNQWRAFISFLECVIIRDLIPDTIAWSFNSDGLFSVGSFCKSLEENIANDNHIFNMVWNGICSPKVEVLVWQILRGRVMVKEVMHRLGYQILDQTCQLCNNSIETVDNLFFHCGWTWKLWATCMGW
ncbi:hypothetical protein Dsin_029305 [Dipteronia sinensis]|uniref:Reverse transcriptase domain-containing protein n=1 Tax=Dipteronia sinensis TaxID=43782 RepID=A0AAE0DVF7_9ROSI|nr:hypothetical protein Dsin_029305 [Dipteronia sinensis]